MKLNRSITWTASSSGELFDEVATYLGQKHSRWHFSSVLDHEDSRSLTITDLSGTDIADPTGPWGPVAWFLLSAEDEVLQMMVIPALTVKEER